MKRLFDVVIALLLALPALLLMAPLIILIRLDTPGPGLFRQVRVGQRGKSFTLYKLRTMTTGTQNLPSHDASHSSITRSGRLLRRLKLDELPQLWNVLNGTMSLVGPRPCLPSQWELINARRRCGVDRLRPGVTGVAQILGIDMSTPEKLAIVDSSYLGQWSIRRDVAILMRTFAGSGNGDAIR